MRLVDNPKFLAYHLEKFRIRNGMDDDGLMEYLGIDSLGLARLRVCLAPLSAAQIQQVAAYCGVDKEKLLQSIGEAEWKTKK